MLLAGTTPARATRAASATTSATTAEPLGHGPLGVGQQGQFAGRVRSYTQTWAQIIKNSGFQPQ